MVEAEADPRQLQVGNLGQQLGQGQVRPVDAEAGEAARQAGQAPAAPVDPAQLGEAQADTRQPQASQPLQQLAQRGGAPVNGQAGQGQAQLRQPQVGQGQVERQQLRQQRLEIKFEVQARQLELRQGHDQLRQAEVGPVEVEVGEGQPQLSQFEVGPMEAAQRCQGGQVERQPRQAQPGQGIDQLGQGQVGPVEPQAGKLGRQVGELELGPAGQQPRQIQVDAQPRQVELRQVEQQLRQAEIGPVDVQVGEGQAQLGHLQGRPAQIRGQQLQREAGVELKQVEAQRQVHRVERQPAHQRRDAIGLGEGGAADGQIATGPGTALEIGDHHLAADSAQAQAGATALAGVTKAQITAGVLQGDDKALKWSAARHQGQQVAADAHAAAQREGGRRAADPQIEIADHLEQLPFGGREGQGGAADRAAADRFTGGVEGQAGRAHGTQHQPRDGAAIALADGQAVGSEAAGTALGRQQHRPVDAAAGQAHTVAAAAGVDGDGGIAEGQAEVGVALAGQHGSKAAAEHLAADAEAGVAADAGGSRGAEAEGGAAAQADAAAAGQADVAAEVAALEARGPIDQAAAQLTEAQADRACSNGRAQVAGAQAPAVVGGGGAAAGVKPQAGASLQAHACDAQIELIKAQLEGGCGGQGRQPAAAPVDNSSPVVEAAIEVEATAADTDRPRQGDAANAAAGGQPAAPTAAAGAGGQHSVQVEATEADPHPASPDRGAKATATKAQLIDRGTATACQGDGLAADRLEVKVAAELQVGTDLDAGLAAHTLFARLQGQGGAATGRWHR